jgi:hypothetical protein
VPEEQEGVWFRMTVRHAKFGVGTVRKIEGERGKEKADGMHRSRECQ